jgi:spore coat protein U-like protein
MRRSTILLTAALLTFGVTAAMAQTADSPTNVDNISATVMTNCTIGTFDLAFGEYDPTSETELDAESTIIVRCTKGTANVFVTMDLGLAGDRTMTDGTDVLDYEIYSASSRLAGDVWPSASPGVAVSFPTAVEQELDIFGRIPPMEGAQAGSYFDTVVATVNY